MKKSQPVLKPADFFLQSGFISPFFGQYNLK